MTLALNQKDAAAALGISVNTFKKQVRPYVRSVTIGRTLLFPQKDLEQWLDRQARSL